MAVWVDDYGPCPDVRVASSPAQVQKEASEQEAEFRVLYRDKYVPLKEAKAALALSLDAERNARAAADDECARLQVGVFASPVLLCYPI